MSFTQANLPEINYTDGTNYATAHPVLDNTGAIISPATSGAQTTGNASLSAIQSSVANIPAAPSTAANQATIISDLATIATNTAAASTPTLAAGTNTACAITLGGNVITASSFNRPNDNTAYASSDLVDISTTAGTVNASPHTIAAARGTDIASVMTRIQLKKSGTSLVNATFRTHFYNAATTVSNGDNGAWLTTSANYLGYFDVTMTQAFTDAAIGGGVPGVGSAMTFKPATGTSNLYYTIEARGAYAPASGETFTLSAEVN